MCCTKTREKLNKRRFGNRDTGPKGGERNSLVMEVRSSRAIAAPRPSEEPIQEGEGWRRTPGAVPPRGKKLPEHVMCWDTLGDVSLAKALGKIRD